jgi:PTS system nitrogen regulatory IIA component
MLRCEFATDLLMLNDLLAAPAVLPALKVKNKKQALQELATRAAEACGRSDREIFETLLQRERLGSTGIGRGVAIPHGKLAKLDQIVGLFARLEKPIEFDAFDGEPVDLLFLLLAPEGAGADHLKALARIARLLRDEKVAEKLRGAKDRDALYALLTAPSTSHAA